MARIVSICQKRRSFEHYLDLPLVKFSGFMEILKAAYEIDVPPKVHTLMTCLNPP